MMLFTIIVIVLSLLSLIVINTENGIVRDCELPFLVPKSSLLVTLLSQLQMKFVGIREIVSKNLKNMIVRFKLQFRNNLNIVDCRLNFLGNGKQRDGPFLGNEVGAIKVSIS